MEIRLLTLTPPMMGGDKGEGGKISHSPRLPFNVFNNGRLPLSFGVAQDLEPVERPLGERKNKVVVLFVSPEPLAQSL